MKSAKQILIGAVIGLSVSLLIAAVSNVTDWSSVTENTTPDGSNYILTILSKAGAGKATNARLVAVTSMQALFGSQPASANLSNWSGIATTTKQPASANLTNWSAQATGIAFYNLTVVTNGINTAVLHFTNGVLMSVTAP